MPLLPINIFQKPDEEKPGTVTVADDFTPTDRPSPMQIDPIELQGGVKPMEVDPVFLTGSAAQALPQTEPIVLHGAPSQSVMKADPVVLSGKAKPRSKMVIDPPIVLKGGPGERNSAPAAKVAAATPAGTPSISTALQDPSFNAFIAERAAARAELAAAQKKGDEAKRWADVSEGFKRMGAISREEKFDENGSQARIAAAASAPVEQVMQKRALDADVLKDFSAQTDLQGKMASQSQMRASMDPNSDVSKRALLLARAQGMVPANFTGEFTANMLDQMEKGAGFQEVMAHHKELEQQAKAQLAETHLLHAETSRHNREEERLKELEIGAKSGKTPARVAEHLAAAQDALNQLDQYNTQATKHGTGIVTGINATINPMAAQDRTTSGQRRALAVVVARGLHGGAPTKIELEEAEKYLPSEWDQPEAFKLKMAAIRKTLEDRHNELVGTLGDVGFSKVAALGSTPRGPGASAPATPSPSGNVVVKNGRTFEKLANGTWIEH